jgi:hypothetical protein
MSGRTKPIIRAVGAILVVALLCGPSGADADCIEDMLFMGMRQCLVSEQGDAGGRREVLEVLNDRDLLSERQRARLRQAFSECLRGEADQVANFIACQNADARIPLNMGRSVLGQPAVR